MRRLATTLALASTLSLALAGSAAGSAFYNSTGSDGPNPAELHLSCGTFCHNDFKIPAGGNTSRPGKGGTFALTNEGGFTGQGPVACELDSNSVQDHGWGVLEYTNAYQWDVYGDDGNPVSGSPFGLKFGAFNDDVEHGPVGCF